MNLDLKKIPFSRFGSYFAFSRKQDTGELYLRDVHGGDESPSDVFKIEALKDGQIISYNIEANETSITIKNLLNPMELVNICISDENIIHIQGQDLGIRLTAVKTRYDNVLQYSLNSEYKQWEYHFYSQEIKMMFSLMEGSASLNAPWKLVGNEFICMDIEPLDGKMHLVIENYVAVWNPKSYESYEVAQKRVNDCYAKWLKSMPQVPDRYSASKELASYITWSCVVHPKGQLKRYAMYMSKNWMFNIWSWDNCFNAMLLSESYPDLALDQLLIFADHQDSSGVYPDFVNDRYCSFSCCKPPIHAWAYKKLRENNNYFNNKQIIEQVYMSLSKSTQYWLTHRRKDDSKLPVYNHGNDSGWDNASIFHVGIPVEAPDLTAHLIYQMDLLSEMADEIGKIQEGEMWKGKADELNELLIKRLWDGSQFIAIYEPDGSIIPYKQSLILTLPIVIGYRLPQDIKEKLIESLKNNFACEYGLATEAYNSPLYKKNGYWLGPVWAPVMYIIVDALNQLGYDDLAKDYAKRFCEATLIGGMAENFDPMTGEGLVDPAFTWTSSVFLRFGKEYL